MTEDQITMFLGMELDFSIDGIRTQFYCIDNKKAWKKVRFDNLISLQVSKKRKREDLYFDKIYFLIENTAYPMVAVDHCFSTISTDYITDFLMGFTCCHKSLALDHFLNYLAENKKITQEVIQKLEEYSCFVEPPELKIDIQGLMDKILKRCDLDGEETIPFLVKRKIWYKLQNCKTIDLNLYIDSLKIFPLHFDDALGNILTILLSRMSDLELNKTLSTHSSLITSYLTWISSMGSKNEFELEIYLRNFRLCFKHANVHTSPHVVNIASLMYLFLTMRVEDSSDTTKVKGFLCSMVTESLVNFDFAASWMLQISGSLEVAFSSFCLEVNEPTQDTFYDHSMFLIRTSLVLFPDSISCLSKMGICKSTELNDMIPKIIFSICSDNTTTKRFKSVYIQLHVLNIAVSETVKSNEKIAPFVIESMNTLFVHLQKQCPVDEKEIKFHTTCLEICFFYHILKLKGASSLKLNILLDRSKEGSWSYTIPLNFLENFDHRSTPTMDDLVGLLVTGLNYIQNHSTILGKHCLQLLLHFANSSDSICDFSKKPLKSLIKAMCKILESNHAPYISEVIKAFSDIATTKDRLETILKSNFVNGLFEALDRKEFDHKSRYVVKFNGVFALHMMCTNPSFPMSLFGEKILASKGIATMKRILVWNDNDTPVQYSMLESAILFLEKISHHKGILQSMITEGICQPIYVLLKNNAFMESINGSMVTTNGELDPFFSQLIGFIRRYLQENTNRVAIDYVPSMVMILLETSFSQNKLVIGKLLIAEIINLLLVVINLYPKIDLTRFRSKLEIYEKTNAISQTYSQHDVTKILKFIKS
jgi:hypothetical protein